MSKSKEILQKYKETLLLIFLPIIATIILIFPCFFVMDKVTLLYRSIASLSFIFLLFIINKITKNLKYYKIIKYLSIFVALIYWSIIILETGCFYITNTGFEMNFWNIFNMKMVLRSITTHIFLSILTTIHLIIYLNILIVFLNIYNDIKLKSIYFSKTLISILIIFFITLNILLSSITSLFNSLDIYRIEKNNYNIEYLAKQIDKKNLFTKVKEEVKPKNVVHIILESYADGFTDNEKYPNLTPNLNKLKKQGVYLKNVEGLYQSSFSYAGNFMSNFGKLRGSNPIEREIKINDAKDINIGDILKKAGYTNVFIRGAERNAIGNYDNIYSQEHGFDIFLSLENLKEKYSEEFIQGWGFQDQVIFDEAYYQYENLNKNDTPFSITLFTVDSHGIDQKPSNICRKDPYKGIKEENNMIQGVYCTDYLLNKFITKISKLPNYKNTLIVIHGDHMPHTLNHLTDNMENNIFGLILNSDEEPFIQEQKVYLYDIPKTIIKNINIDTNANFLLGENILDKDFKRTIKTNPELKNVFLKIDYNSLNILEKLDTPINKLSNYSKKLYSDKNADIYFDKKNQYPFNRTSLIVTNNDNTNDIYEVCLKKDYSSISSSSINKTIRNYQNLFYKKKCMNFDYDEISNSFYINFITSKTSFWQDGYIIKNGKKLNSLKL